TRRGSRVRRRRAMVATLLTRIATWGGPFRDRYRGLLYNTASYSQLVLALLCVLLAMSYLLNWGDAGLAAVWPVVVTYRARTHVLLRGLALLFLIVGAPWLIIPGLSQLLDPRAQRFVFRRHLWRSRFLVLFLLSVLVVLLAVVAIPGLVISAHSRGYTLEWLWGVSGIIGILPPTLLAAWNMLGPVVKGWLAPNPNAVAMPVLEDFPELRPQNTRVVNLDVGALAPRLNCVVDAMHAWHRYAEEFAPTSATLRAYVRTDPARGVRTLRTNVAQL